MFILVAARSNMEVNFQVTITHYLYKSCNHFSYYHNMIIIIIIDISEEEEV